MVNNERVACKAVALAVLIVFTTAAPSPRYRQKYYDQRQTGTENYRVKIDGVVAVIPADLVTSAIEASIDDETLLTLELSVLHFPFSLFPIRDTSSNSSSSITTEIAPADNKPDLEDKPAEGNPVKKPIDEKPQEEKPLEGKVPEEKPSSNSADKSLEDILVAEELLEEKELAKRQQSDESKKSTGDTAVKNIKNTSS